MVQRDFDYIMMKTDNNNIKRYYLNGKRIKPGKAKKLMDQDIEW